MSIPSPKRPSPRSNGDAGGVSGWGPTRLAEIATRRPGRVLAVWGRGGRIHERWAATGDTAGAIVHGVASTARLITGAAAIIIVVFAGFASGQLVAFQEMGFGIAVALALDATLVRLLLIPAAMRLLGERNWYLPSWLPWLPDLQVEGHQPPSPPADAHEGAPKMPRDAIPVG